MDKQELQIAFEAAEVVLRNDPFFQGSDSTSVRWHYGLFHVGDQKLLAYGLTWKLLGEANCRCVKIQDGVITDYYVIYPKDSRYASSEVNPKTMKVIVNYDRSGNNELKKTASGMLMQKNIFVKHWSQMPDDFKNDVPDIIKESIYLYAVKPYGKIVEFGLRQLFPNKQPRECL